MTAIIRRIAARIRTRVENCPEPARPCPYPICHHNHPELAGWPS